MKVIASTLTPALSREREREWSDQAPSPAQRERAGGEG
jgi:hypothetical protein